MEFYSLKHRRMVTVPRADVRLRVLTRLTKKGPQERYLLEAKTLVDGSEVSLCKFVSKAAYAEFDGNRA